MPNYRIATQEEHDAAPPHHRFEGQMSGKLIIDDTDPLDCPICQQLAADADQTGMSKDEQSWLG